MYGPRSMSSGAGRKRTLDVGRIPIWWGSDGHLRILGIAQISVAVLGWDGERGPKLDGQGRTRGVPEGGGGARLQEIDDGELRSYLQLSSRF